jgi:hydrogenase maturation protein HypF
LPEVVESTAFEELNRVKVTVHGAVQGVGFRPFVYRLATQLRLHGWVLNSSQGVFIEVEGPTDALDEFLERLENEKPPLAIIQSIEASFLDGVGYDKFEIRFSEQSGEKIALILPDVATCSDCLQEILDPANRRYRYPFTNCTNCGPRFSIIEALPYDRPNTSMKRFRMCPDCAREYHDASDRRFHAQPNACSRCGPKLELWDERAAVLAQHDSALRRAAEWVRDGKILALKGVGGFQFIVDARQERAVLRLRTRKRREGKPFALMYPSLEQVGRDCLLSSAEERLLVSSAAPIVLLRRRSGAGLAPSVAPGSPYFGAMLPYTPLHHLLLLELGFPIVATSGNLVNEPICIDEREALERLRGIADGFLVHDRPIVRQVDDSVSQVICGREMLLRRARGYAPLPIRVKAPLPCVLGLGAHLKNNVALSVGSDIFVSQHIGDLETPIALAAFHQIVADLPRLYEAQPEIVACDLHPDYLSTKCALGLGARTVQQVQHHWAHVLACMAENELEGPMLGVSWDGTGFGADGTIWGGEFLRSNDQSFERVASFRPFRLPGGEAAVREPRRSAAAILFEVWGKDGLADRALAPNAEFTAKELALIERMLRAGLNAPITSSVGRLFDAVASLIGLRQRVTFEGQAAIELESAIAEGVNGNYSFTLIDGTPQIVDWAPMITEIVDDLRAGEPAGLISAKFHHTLVEIIVQIAQTQAEPKVILTGGCFQNRYLLELSISRLSQAGFKPYWHQRIPPNDGSIALGQVVAAAKAGLRIAKRD